MFKKYFTQTAHKQSEATLLKTNTISALVCIGASKLADANNKLESEILCKKNKHINSTVRYKAVIYTDKNRAIQHLSRDGEIIDLLHIKGDNPCIRSFNSTSELLHYLKLSQNQSDRILLSSYDQSLEASTICDKSLYTFYNSKRDVFYSMAFNGEISSLDSLIRQNGFVEWISKNKPELLYDKNCDVSEFLFFWLIKCIVTNDIDTLDGLRTGMSSLLNQSFKGHYNLLFADGTGVYAFSYNLGNNSDYCALSYKINRDEFNILSYQISSNKHDDNYIVMKENNVYYFPSRGALQRYVNLSPMKQQYTKVDQCLNYVFA